MKNVVWISYDLGIGGDYEGIYAWLDRHHARECGDSMAYLPDYQCTGDVAKTLKSDLQLTVEINKKSKIYIVYQDFQKKKPIGSFIFGRRKAAPWAGCSGEGDELDSDE
ncbi:MAG: hypothetical protein WCF85_04525 [Rhodospirillaceae bacterium]